MNDNKQQFFDRWAPNYDCLFTTIFYQAVHKRLIEYIQLSNHPQVLDLGCGTGRLLTRLADLYPDLCGIGFDFSRAMLREARHNNRHHPRLIYLQGNAEALPFSEAQFEAIFNTISFLHYPQPHLVLQEVNRVLRPQGYFYLVDTIGSNESNFTTVPFSPGGVQFYNESQRERLGKDAGLECVGHKYLIGPILLTIFSKS
jgi:ubiquinone/menaquinone biosynthesis C-methylase UbiE